MRPVVSILLLAIAASFFHACKKKNDGNACFPGVATVRKITDQPAIIKVTATVYSVYIVEQGAVDTKLIPCNLPQEYLQNDLPVTISGEVKATVQGGGPCCSENFVLTRIRR